MLKYLKVCGINGIIFSLTHKQKDDLFKKLRKINQNENLSKYWKNIRSNKHKYHFILFILK